MKRSITPIIIILITLSNLSLYVVKGQEYYSGSSSEIIVEEVLFSDNFDDKVIDQMNWSVSGIVNENNGYLTIGPGSKMRSQRSFGNDVILEFDMKLSSGDQYNRAEGAGFRDQYDANNIIFYDYNSNPDTICIGTKLNGYWSFIDWLPCDSDLNWNAYRIERTGNEVNFYQNDKLLVTKTNYIPQINLELEFYSSGTFYMYIDNIKVYTKKSIEVRHPEILIDEFVTGSNRCDVGCTQSIRLHAKWDNESDVSEGLIYINGKGYKTNSGGWVIFNEASSVVEKKTWRVTAVNCSSVYDFTQTAPSPSIIWDRVNVTLSVSDDRIDVGSKADVRWTAFYAYDGSPFQGKVNLKIISSQTSTPTPVGKSYYQVESIEDSKYGLTEFTSNQVDCVWDRVKITQGGVSNQVTRTGNMESVWFKAIYEYDSKEFTGEPTADGGMNKIWVNGIPMIWSSFDKVWKYSTKLDDNGKLTFEVTGVEDMQYKLTKFIDAAGPQSITWEKPFLETTVGIVSIAAVLAIIVAGVIFFLRKRI